MIDDDFLPSLKNVDPKKITQHQVAQLQSIIIKRGFQEIEIDIKNFGASFLAEWVVAIYEQAQHYQSKIKTENFKTKSRIFSPEKTF